MKRKTKEEPIKVGDKVKFGRNEYKVVQMWTGGVAVIENDAHRWTVSKDKLKKI